MGGRTRREEVPRGEGMGAVSDERNLEREARQEACTHYKIMPKFDEEAAKGLTAHEVRAKWPRFYGECPDCGQRGIYYASYVHYIAGDW